MSEADPDLHQRFEEARRLGRRIFGEAIRPTRALEERVSNLARALESLKKTPVATPGERRELEEKIARANALKNVLEARLGSIRSRDTSSIVTLGIEAGPFLEVRRTAKLKPGQWHHVAVTYDGHPIPEGVRPGPV